MLNDFVKYLFCGMIILYVLNHFIKNEFLQCVYANEISIPKSMLLSPTTTKNSVKKTCATEVGVLKLKPFC